MRHTYKFLEEKDSIMLFLMAFNATELLTIRLVTQ